LDPGQSQLRVDAAQYPDWQGRPLAVMNQSDPYAVYLRIQTQQLRRV
jgi:hypothetical protein